MSYLINPHRFGGTTTVYDDARAVYSTLQMFDNWTNAVVSLRRSSDDDTTYVFFDTNGEITTSSFIGTATTPTGTTLGTWIGSDNGYVRGWVSQNSSNTYDSADDLQQLSNSVQPMIVSAGVVNLKNGQAQIDFSGGTKNMGLVGGFSELDTGNDYTIYTISHNDTSSNLAGILSSSETNSTRMVMYNDRSASKGLANINDGSSHIISLASQVNSSNQRLQTSQVDSAKNIDGWYNGTAVTGTTYSGSYTNDIFRLGLQNGSSSPLTGGIQLVIIYAASDTDATAIHSDINNKFGVY